MRSISCAKPWRSRMESAEQPNGSAGARRAFVARIARIALNDNPVNRRDGIVLSSLGVLQFQEPPLSAPEIQAILRKQTIQNENDLGPLLVYENDGGGR